MHSLDIAILVIIAIPTLVGVLYGFLNIIFSLLAWALSLGISVKFAPYFSPMLAGSINSPILQGILAFIGLFIVSLIILTGIGFFVVKLLGRTGLTAVDRILGLFFGMGLGTVIIAIIIFLTGFTTIPMEPWWEMSRIVKPFERVSVWAERFLPENVAKYHGYELSTPEDANSSPDPEQEITRNVITEENN